MTPVLTITLNPALDIFGSINEIEIGPKLRCEGGQIDAGGGGVNVSRAIKILGGDSEAFVATAGVLGDVLVKQIRKHDIEPIRYETDGHTRQSLSIFEELSGKQLRLILPGPIWTQAQIDGLLECVLLHTKDSAIVVASGSLPPGVPENFYINLNTALRQKNARMVLDTSNDVLMTSVKSVQRPYYVLRMDRLEAEFLAGHSFPTPIEMAAFAQKMVNDNVAEIVILARGAEGSVFASATERFHVQPPKTPVRSVVGAGDSFVGALTMTLANGGSLKEAAILATATASSAVQTSASGLCVREVVDQIMTECVTAAL
ncbi:MAG: sugar kinase [Rhodobacteraceae bacterium]|nr:MAG: sugar kinase [Paracoccaceae bacterium]